MQLYRLNNPRKQKFLDYKQHYVLKENLLCPIIILEHISEKEKTKDGILGYKCPFNG
jgi:hypothetical protein